MAITKQAVVDQLTQGDTAALKRIEKALDAWLPANYDRGSYATYDLRTFGESASNRVIDALLARYRSAGWTVTHRYGDQHDYGSFLTFS